MKICIKSVTPLKEAIISADVTTYFNTYLILSIVFREAKYAIEKTRYKPNHDRFL